MQDLTLAAITMNSRSDKALNVEVAIEHVRRAAAAGAKWILLPEVFSYHGPYDRLAEMAEPEQGPLNQRLAALAKELGVTIFAGSVPELPSPGEQRAKDSTSSSSVTRVYNTQYVFGPTGDLIAKYRKVHLFNLTGEGESPTYNESMGYLAGNQIVTAVIDGWRVGFATCYDLRFPAFFYQMTAKTPVDILVVPSAFTKKTGEAHWQLLLQARAVECQCFLFSANQTGEHSPGKESFGHSLIIDPWGKILADSGLDTGIIYRTVSKAELGTVRGRLPALDNRRSDLY